MIYTINSKENLSHDLVIKNIQELRQENLNQELSEREDLINFYENRQDLDKYLKNWGFKDQDALPLQFIGLFKKIIDKISLVYKNPPDRDFGEDTNSYDEWIEVNPRFNVWLKEAERYKNTLGVVLKRPIYSQALKKWRFFVDTTFIPHFAENDPFSPIAYSIPVKVDNITTAKGNITKDWWMYWSDTQYFWYTSGDDIWYDEDFAPNGEHDLGLMPIVESRTNFPIDDYWVTGAADLMQSNQSININLNNLNYAVHFQAFNYLWADGIDEKDVDKLKVATNKITTLPEGSTLNNLDLNPKLTEMIESIKFEIEAISRTYNINVDWAMSGQPSSGFALMVKNIDLMEAREDDVDLAELEEKQLYKVIQAQQEKFNINEPKLPKDEKLNVNFRELDFPVNEKEAIEIKQWKIDNNMLTPIDILQEEEGLTEDEATERWERNKGVNAIYTPGQLAVKKAFENVGDDETQPDEEE